MLRRLDSLRLLSIRSTLLRVVDVQALCDYDVVTVGYGVPLLPPRCKECSPQADVQLLESLLGSLKTRVSDGLKPFFCEIPT